MGSYQRAKRNWDSNFKGEGYEQYANKSDQSRDDAGITPSYSNDGRGRISKYDRAITRVG